MSDRALLPVSPFNEFEDESLPDEQRAAKILVQVITDAGVRPFEQERQAVNRDHVEPHNGIFGENFVMHFPTNTNASGRKV